MIKGITIILISIIFIWNGQFWKYNYKRDSKIQDKIRLFVAGLLGIILGIWTLIDGL